MMAGKKTPDGRRVTVCTKLSEAQAAALDHARGEQSRSAWVYSVIMERLDPAPREVTRKPPARPVTATVLARERAQDRRADNCKHEHVIKHWCNECKTGGH